MAKSKFAVECGRRLKRTREALGFSVRRQFAVTTEVDQTNLARWELGEVLVPPVYVVRLKDQFGVSLDWIYAGDAGGLPRRLADTLLPERPG